MGDVCFVPYLYSVLPLLYKIKGADIHSGLEGEIRNDQGRQWTVSLHDGDIIQGKDVVAMNWWINSETALMGK